MWREAVVGSRRKKGGGERRRPGDYRSKLAN